MGLILPPRINICQSLGNINSPAEKLRAQREFFWGLSRFTRGIMSFSLTEFNIDPTVVEHINSKIFKPLNDFQNLKSKF